MRKIEGAHPQYVKNHYAKFEKKDENFWSYRLHKIGIGIQTKDGKTGRKTDGRTDNAKPLSLHLRRRIIETLASIIQLSHVCL